MADISFIPRLIEASTILQSFRKVDPDCTGKIQLEQLFEVLSKLDSRLTRDNVTTLISASASQSGNGDLDYHTLVRWFFFPSLGDDLCAGLAVLQKENVSETLCEAVRSIGATKPRCPLEFLSDFFGRKADEKEPESLHAIEADAKIWREKTEALVEERERQLTPRGDFKVLMVDVNKAALHGLERCGTVDFAPKMTSTELAQCIGGYDALVCRSSVTVTREVVESALPRLKMIALSQVGMDNVPIELCAERGVRICNSPVGNTVTTAEHTLALIFAMVRRLPAADQSIKNGLWTREPFMGNQLSGNVLGVLGLGNIAFHVAKGAHAMGMKIVAYDPYAPQEKADSINATLYRKIEELPDLLKVAKVLSIHVPLTSQTKNLIGREQIQTMQPGSYIVNCARGGIVDEEALSEALKSGHLNGAAADVFVKEKEFVDAKSVPEDFCLVTAPSMVMTPHLGAMTTEAQEAVAIDAALQVEEFLIKGIEPKYGIVKPDPANPGKFIDGRPAWMK